MAWSNVNDTLNTKQISHESDLTYTVIINWFAVLARNVRRVGAEECAAELQCVLIGKS